jgi:hypothetical protein
MLDVKGYFRVNKVRQLKGNIQYAVLLLKDRLMFVKIGGQFADGSAGTIAAGAAAGGIVGTVIGSLIGDKIDKKAADKQDSKLESLFDVSAEELLAQDKLNFEIPYAEIDQIEMKDASFNMNGAREGVFNIQRLGKKEKYDIAPGQNFADCVDTVRLQLSDKVPEQPSVRRKQGALALLGLALVAAVAIIVPVALSNQWAEFTSEEGAFSVDMPGNPQYEVLVTETNIGPVNIHSCTVDKGSHAYQVTYTDYGSAVIDSGTPDQILDGACEGVIAGTDVDLISQGNCSLGQFPGREMVYAVNEAGITSVHRVFLVEDRMYQVITLSDQAEVMTDDAQRFLDSFRLN